MKLYLIFAKSPYSAPEQGFRFGGSVRELDVDMLLDMLPSDEQTWKLVIETGSSGDCGLDLPEDLEAMLKAYLAATDVPPSDEQSIEVWPEDHPLHTLSEERTEP